MGFVKFKRMFKVFGTIFVITSYLLFSNLWSQEFDKLLHALTTSAFISKFLNICWSGWHSMCSVYYT